MEYILSLSPFIIVLIVATFNWLMTFLGASLVLFVKNASKKLVCIALGSSAGIMIAASFFSLILPAKEQLESTGKLNLLIIPIGFICGVSLLMLIDKLLPHEHMMSHVQEGINPAHYSKNKLLMFSSRCSICRMSKRKLFSSFDFSNRYRYSKFSRRNSNIFTDASMWKKPF